jgi:signal transduction histidine kinase
MNLYRKIQLIIGAALLVFTALAWVLSQAALSKGYLLLALALVGLIGAGIISAMIHRLIFSRLRALAALMRQQIDLQPVDDDAITDLNALTNMLLQALDFAQKEATAGHAKNTFLANMNHELRTPLNAIIGFTSVLLMSEKLDEKDLHRIERIHANGENLLRIVDDLLELSRIEAGRIDLVPTNFALHEVVEAVEGQVMGQVKEKGLQLNRSIAPDVPAIITADQDAIEQIIYQLLANAVKFTEAGSIYVNIKRKDDNLIIAVQDTGIGIPPHMHDIIFESFRQVDESATRPRGGRGLGLVIVNHLCKAMNGTIQLDSHVGQGSTFTATLPLLRSGEIVTSR